MEGLLCLAKRLGPGPTGSDAPRRDDDLRGLFGAVLQEDGSGADLEQNLHLTT